MSIINFLSRLRFGDEYDFLEVDGWEVTTWSVIGHGAGMLPVRYMHIQLDNDKAGKHYIVNDVQSEAELTRSLRRIIEKVGE